MALKFFSTNHLRRWLKNHPEGQKISEAIFAERLAHYERVLVVLSSDGWVEVYGSAGVRIHLAEKIHANTAKEGCLVEEYLDLALPRSFAEIYYPNRLKKCGVCRKLTFEDVYETKWKLEALEELRDVWKEMIR